MATTNHTIPILDLSTEIDELWEPLNEAIQRVLRSGQFIIGPEVNELECDLAGFTGTRFAVGLNSGTDALVIGLRAMGIGPGDEVITSPFTFVASPESICRVGAQPVFADISPYTFNIDPDAIEAAITDRTKAIMPVHLFGQPADMEAITLLAKKHDLQIIEDAAQAFGAQLGERCVGSFGNCGAFSFFPTKNLGTYGDGGFLATDDPAIDELARKLRNHGSIQKYRNELHGYNSRLDALQAAILRVKLPFIEQWNEARRDAAARYDDLLKDVQELTLPPRIFPGHVYHQYTVRIAGGKRDVVAKAMNEAGVSTMVYYPVPCHHLPVYADQDWPEMPVAEQVADEVLSLPIWPKITPEQQQRVADVLKQAIAD
jgi:dTDP-4-amino-4,6-dideoxygalactose transaminase